jgi:hypothetical protein
MKGWLHDLNGGFFIKPHEKHPEKPFTAKVTEQQTLKPTRPKEQSKKAMIMPRYR